MTRMSRRGFLGAAGASFISLPLILRSKGFDEQIVKEVEAAQNGVEPPTRLGIPKLQTLYFESVSHGDTWSSGYTDIAECFSIPAGGFEEDKFTVDYDEQGNITFLGNLKNASVYLYLFRQRLT